MRTIGLILTALILILIPSTAWTAGSVTAEADLLHGFRQFRNQTGFTGEGVTIGVLGEGILGFEEHVQSGDLPSNIQLLDGDQGPWGFSIPMLEVIYDLAPGVEFVFDEAPVEEWIDDSLPPMADRADIILVEQSYPGLPIYESGAGADAAQQIVDDGTLVVTGAHDLGQAHYRATFNPTDEGLHDFGGGQTRISLTVPSSCTGAVLQVYWVPLPDVSEYRAMIYDTDGELLGETAPDPPGQPLSVTPPNIAGEFLIEVTKISGVTKTFDLMVSCISMLGDTAPQFEPLARTDKGSILGVAAASGVLTIGSLDEGQVSGDVYLPREYTSRGPVELLRPDQIIREKPDLAALDCQSTSRGPEPICGSRISAAVVTASAALLQEKLQLTHTADLRGILLNSARDVPPSGIDRTTGHGQLDLFAAANTEPVPFTMVTLCLTLLAAGWVLATKPTK